VIGQALGRAIGGAARQALTAPAEQATATPGVRTTMGEQLSGAIVNLSSAGYIGDAGLDALLAPVLPLDELLAMREASGTLTSQEVAAIRAMRDDMAAGIVRAQNMAVFGQGQGGRFQSAAFDTHYSGAVSSNSISTFELRLRKANFDAFVGSLGDNPSSKQLIDIFNYRLALQADENNLNAALAIADRTIIDMIGAVWGGVDVAKGTYRIAVNGEHTLDNYISAGSGILGAAVGGAVKVGKGLISPLLKSGRVAERGVVRGPTGDIYSVAFEARLSPSSYPNVSRGRHFQEANESLLKAMEGDAVFAQGMEGLGVNLNRTPRGLAPRTSPGDWVWHHAQEPGVMQLVPRSQRTRQHIPKCTASKWTRRVFAMGQRMILGEVLANLAQLDREDTIYVAEPWTRESEAIIAREPDEGGVPEEVSDAKLSYFLEVSVAQEFVAGWLASQKEVPTSFAICERLIDYAANDA
jgi:hypothetical protein